MRFFLALPLFFCLFVSVLAQSVDWSIESESAILPGLPEESFAGRVVPDQRVRKFILPQRILWETESGLQNSGLVLTPPLGQTSTSEMKNGFTMTKKAGEPCAILLDFGAEIHGGIRLDARDLKALDGQAARTVKVRVRFGESADEAMAELGDRGAGNDHSMRDQVVSVPWLGSIEVGESAFRFVRLDLVDDGTSIVFDSIRAIFTYRDLPWLGSFRCSDERLNTIWRTAAHTQHLTMQNYIFEGAKRDRLVWMGDFNPQGMTTLYVFGAPQVLKDTLGELVRSQWPLPKWMNGMPNYSLWWIISTSDVYRFSGDLEFVKTQHEYLAGLVDLLEKYIDPQTGKAGFPSPFLDWPTAKNRPALDAGTHAMFVIALERTAEIARALKDAELEKKAETLAATVRIFVPDHAGNKQAAAIMNWAGLENPEKPNVDVLLRGGAEGFSTFYGYYMLEALARAGRTQEAMNVVRDFWGGMIDVGATTFWEDFDLKWLENAGRIDELTPEGKESLHGDRGAFCYEGFRHSLCHGWASGPAAWLSAHILGVTPVEPGFKTVRIEPFLGDLDWAEGTVPTPHGVIFVRAEKNADGTIKKTVKVPEGVTWISDSEK